MADQTCPFCGAPEAPDYMRSMDEALPVYECHTLIDNGGDEERTRTHHCYMNQIRALQTGETKYGQGFQDGVRAMREVVREALDGDDWLLKNPPMRRPGHRYEDRDVTTDDG